MYIYICIKKKYYKNILVNKLIFQCFKENIFQTMRYQN